MAKKLHPLTLQLLLLKDDVRLHTRRNLRHLTPSGVFIPYVLTSTTLPVDLMTRVREIEDCVSVISDFEEFAVAIESVAKLARLKYKRLPSYWLHGGNYFIQINYIPSLNIDTEMIQSAIYRHSVRNDKNTLLKEVASPVQLENVINNDIQLELWIQGYSVHNAYPWAWVVNDKDKILDITVGEGGECCPDYSCCSGKPGWSIEQRKAFFRADESTRWQMLTMSLQGLSQDVVGVITHTATFDYGKYNQ